MPDLKDIIKQYALELGFDLVRVTSADEFLRDRDIALERLGRGLMDGLPWYTAERIRRGSRPQELLPGARSIICLGLSYWRGDEPAADPEPAGGSTGSPRAGLALAGRVARYAQGLDYHTVMKRRMRECVAGLSARLDRSIAARWYVDDGPMLDRAAAARAGLGWFGKNTNILTSSHGSWVVLGQIITDLELEPDLPLKKSCGQCRRCIPACPTGALAAEAPYVIDNTRCISYLTIEHRGAIPRELRPLMQDWVFGCDLCQEVCPVNRAAQPSRETTFGRKDLALLELVGLLSMTEAEFRARFRGTPILRAKRAGLQRNACVALGNRRDSAATPALARALREGEPLVRSHAAWALGQICGVEAKASLEQAREQEADSEVLAEIGLALERFAGCQPGAEIPPTPPLRKGGIGRA
ncbi:MAG: tRNA epoxyqueuosine(34) reductase QueG [Dehalococcoidia bacterium]|nr:tRNA epoxyqueuosine(34) reductase QueG [Dehalococcoidia bacterium]MSQ16786.1 tRNA epoxyqueuosine(34) reductase QueG [Dehalococcoidia bacterium]